MLKNQMCLHYEKTVLLKMQITQAAVLGQCHYIKLSDNDNWTKTDFQYLKQT